MITWNGLWPKLLCKVIPHTWTLRWHDNVDHGNIALLISDVQLVIKFQTRVTYIHNIRKRKIKPHSISGTFVQRPKRPFLERAWTLGLLNQTKGRFKHVGAITTVNFRPGLKEFKLQEESTVKHVLNNWALRLKTSNTSKTRTEEQHVLLLVWQKRCWTHSYIFNNFLSIYPAQN